MRIAITGGIATGKSTVARLLGRYLGVEIVDADKICRDLLVKGQPGWDEVRRIWGERFLIAGGEIDRILLRKSVFSDRQLRRKLEEILHPMARTEIARASREKEIAGENLLVEVPLLFEVGWRYDFDWIVTIYATEKRCLQRIVIRDNVTSQDAAKVLAAQMPLVCKALLADSVIDNSGHLANTCFQVCHLAEYLRNLY